MITIDVGTITTPVFRGRSISIRITCPMSHSKKMAEWASFRIYTLKY